MNRDRPKLIIIGAGLAGMATGAYAQMNGFDSRIFEIHVLPGRLLHVLVEEGVRSMPR